MIKEILEKKERLDNWIERNQDIYLFVAFLMMAIPYLMVGKKVFAWIP